MTDRHVRRPGSFWGGVAPARTRRGRVRPSIEGLEGRALLAAFLRPGPVINTSMLAGNQTNVSIAINPLNPNNIVTMSEFNPGPGNDLGLVTSRSFDGGASWTTQIVADGYGVMVPADRNPNLAFDGFGNLFATYVDFTNQGVQLAISTDGGASFKCIHTYTPFSDQGNPLPVDRPAISTGSNSVWVTFQGGVELDESQNDPRDVAMYTGSARVIGLGQVGNYNTEIVPNTTPPEGDPPEVNFGSVAVGLNGQVIIAYQDSVDLAGTSAIFTSADPDGLGTGSQLQIPNFVTGTTVGGEFYVPPQTIGHIDAEVGLAYDLSDGPNRGRLYMIYTDSPAINCGCTYVSLIYSDNDGALGSWSDPITVNDNVVDSANFNPKIAVDPVTGHVAVSFYSARNDPGFGPPGDRDNLSNSDVELFATVSTDGGLSFSPNVQVSNGPTSSSIAGNNNGQDLGRYTGLAFFNDLLYPAWADNSVNLAGNPTPDLLDVAVSRVQALFFSAQGVQLNVIEDTPFTAQVATFTDTDPGAGSRTAANFAATIDWGDGTPISAGTVVSLGGTTYGVIGTHTYAASGAFPIGVTARNLVNGRTDVAQSTAIVAEIPVPLSGQLDPASGASGGFANTSQPTFIGTTLPGASVQMFAQPVGSTQLIPIGQTIAAADGTWRITSIPLDNGSYLFFATATEPVGGSSTTIQIPAGTATGPLVVDTIGPQVTGLTFDPQSGRIRLALRDDLSGLDPSRVGSAANYVLTRSGSSPFALASLVVTPGTLPTDTVFVDLAYSGRMLRGTDYLFRIVAAGLTDRAGNALDGDFFGYFPSGNGRQDGDFLARLDSIHGTVFPAESTTPLPSAPRQGPVGRFRTMTRPSPFANRGFPTARFRSPTRFGPRG